MGSSEVIDFAKEYASYYCIETFKSGSGWRNFHDENFILGKDQNKAIEYAEKLSVIYPRIRVVHKMCEVVWENE